MSSRSLGLLAGFFVSQGKSSPANCRLINSGSSVRKRMRPCSRTLSGRFSILRSRRELITLDLSELMKPRGQPEAECGQSLAIVTRQVRCDLAELATGGRAPPGRTSPRRESQPSAGFPSAPKGKWHTASRHTEDCRLD